MRTIFKLAGSVLIVFMLAIGLLLFKGASWLNSHNKLKNEALSNIQTIPRFQESVFLGKSSTEGPDSIPSIGIDYLSKANCTAVFSFYKDLIVQNHWEIIKEFNNQDVNMGKIIEIKIPNQTLHTVIIIKKAEDLKNGISLVHIFSRL